MVENSPGRYLVEKKNEFPVDKGRMILVGWVFTGALFLTTVLGTCDAPPPIYTPPKTSQKK